MWSCVGSALRGRQGPDQLSTSLQITPFPAGPSRLPIILSLYDMYGWALFTEFVDEEAALSLRCFLPGPSRLLAVAEQTTLLMCPSGGAHHVNSVAARAQSQGKLGRYSCQEGALVRKARVQSRRGLRA